MFAETSEQAKLTRDTLQYWYAREGCAHDAALLMSTIAACMVHMSQRYSNKYLTDADVLNIVQRAESGHYLPDDVRVLCEQTRQRLNSVAPAGMRWELVKQ